MPSRDLDFPVFDADDHFYEPQEALTQFLPDRRNGIIDYIDVDGRTTIVVRYTISDYIPNPTFKVVTTPGAQKEYFRHGSGGKSYREVMGKPMKAIPAFRNPEARLELREDAVVGEVNKGSEVASRQLFHERRVVGGGSEIASGTGAENANEMSPDHVGLAEATGQGDAPRVQDLTGR